MKKIVMTMVALLTMTAAVAQDGEKRERREFKKPTPEEITNRMAEELKLDDKQKEKVLKLNKEYESVLMGGPGMGRGPRGPRPDGETGASKKNDGQKERPQRPEMTDEQKAKMKAHMEKRQEYDKKLKEILTDEQYETYKKMHQRHGRHGGPRGHHGNGGPRPDKE